MARSALSLLVIWLAVGRGVVRRRRRLARRPDDLARTHSPLGVRPCYRVGFTAQPRHPSMSFRANGSQSDVLGGDTWPLSTLDK